MTERRSQIVLADELPAAKGLDGRRHIRGRIPAIETGSPKPEIALPDQVVMNAQIHHMILDQDQPWTPAPKIDAVEDLYRVPLDIDREEIDRCGRARLVQNLVKRPHRNC